MNSLEIPHRQHTNEKTEKKGKTLLNIYECAYPTCAFKYQKSPFLRRSISTRIRCDCFQFSLSHRLQMIQSG